MEASRRMTAMLTSFLVASLVIAAGVWTESINERYFYVVLGSLSSAGYVLGYRVLSKYTNG